MFFLFTQLLVLPSGQAFMQAPEDSTASSSVYPPELSATAPMASDHWLSNHLDGQLDHHVIDPSTGQGADAPLGKTSLWKWQFGGALASTAAVSAGLAVPFSGEHVIAVPVSATELPPLPEVSETATTLVSQQATQAAAFNQGRGIDPSADATPQPLVDQPSFSQSSPANLSNSSSALFPTAPTDASVSGSPQLVMDNSGSWTLSYSDTAGSAANPVPTQAVVNQLVTQNRTQPDCFGATCRSLEYIQKQLPEARQKVTSLQQKLAEFENQHGQSDLSTYRSVLSDRLSEITNQRTDITLQLSATKRYIRQIEVRLATIEIAPDLPEHLLGIDDAYQAHWLKLQQTEHQLLEEFSQAKVDGTALNRIYDRYEQQQIELYQAAQAVLGNYLLSADNQGASGRAGAVYKEPAALELLQSLTVATHQRDVQQLRARTVQLATQKLQTKHSQLAQNFSEYERLQRELNLAQQRVAQYEAERDRIAAEATATTLITAPASNATGSTTSSPAFATAAALESKVPEGSIGKTLLGIVIAAGTVAVAAQRRAGNVSKALSLEIIPRPKRPKINVAPIQARVKGPLQPDLLTELFEVTGQRPPALALPSGAIPSQNTYKPISQTYSEQDSSVEQALMGEIMSRELKEFIAESTPEVRFARELSHRNIEPVQLSLDELDAFAESAVRWVLNDLDNTETLDTDSLVSEKEKATVSA